MLTNPHDVVEEIDLERSPDLPLDAYRAAINSLIQCRQLLARAEQDLLAASSPPAVAVGLLQQAKNSVHAFECVMVDRAMRQHPTMARPFNHLRRD